MLTRIQIPSSVDSTPIPDELAARITSARGEIEAFQDRWDRPQIEQFVAADYHLVYQCLNWTLQFQPRLGQRFLEWGSGFSIVSAIAAEMGLNAIGIEAESDLLAMGRKTIQTWNVNVELVRGNFLPPGADLLSEDPMLPSLGHDVLGPRGRASGSAADLLSLRGRRRRQELDGARHDQVGTFFRQISGPVDHLAHRYG